MEMQIKENTHLTKVNTAITLDTKEKVDEVYEILVAAKGAIKVMNALAAIAKWAGIIAAAATAIYVTWHQLTHGGSLPK